MPSERVVRRVAHSAADMFELVADLERYPEFVPGCRALEVLNRDVKDGREHVSAAMRVGYRMITERFLCQVTIDRPGLAIDVDYVEGPLRHLTNAWRFADMAAGGSEVDFQIAFELRSRRLGFLVSTLFDRVFMRFVDAFEARADALYGARSRRA